MNLEYNVYQRLKELLTVLDEYTEWFMQVVRRVTYPAGNEKIAHFSKPTSFLKWADRAEADDFAPEMIARLCKLHDELSLKADKLINESMKHARPVEFSEFNKLVTLFEEFLHHTRRLERDVMLEDSGIDTLTGLRSYTVLEKDLGRELERLARQGKAFSLALVRIDNFEELKKENSQEISNGYLKLVAELIKKSMRSFDDAYRLETNEFALSLKQANMNGGFKALERLKRELEKSRATCNLGGKIIPLTLSSCIAEPLPGDNLKELLQNLRQDLDKSGKAEGSVLEYFEMSPLQRFIKETGDKA